MRKNVPAALAAVLALAIALALLFGCTQAGQKQPENVFVLGKDLTEPLGNTTSQNPQFLPNSNPTANQSNPFSQSQQVPGVSLILITDKPAYTSQEKVRISARFESKDELPGVRVRIHGLKNLAGREVFNQDRLFHAMPGEVYWANFTHELAFCAACTGFPPGAYSLYATAVWEEKNETLAQANSTFYLSP